MSPSLWAGHQRQPRGQPSLVKMYAGSDIFRGFGSGHKPRRLQGSHGSKIVQEGGSRRSKVVTRGRVGTLQCICPEAAPFANSQKGTVPSDAALDCAEPTAVTQAQLPSPELRSGKANIPISFLTKISCLFLFWQQAQIILKCCGSPSTVHCRHVT